MAINISGIRRVKPDTRNGINPPEVRTPGGWMAWSMVSPENQKYVLGLPEVQPYRDGTALKLTPFEHIWKDLDDPVDPGSDPMNDPRAPEPTTPSGNPTFSDPSPKAKFELPSPSTDGVGPGGVADDKLVTEANGGEPKLVPFDEAYRPRAESLGKEIMDQTLKVTYAVLADTVTALTDDIADALTATKGEIADAVAETLKSFKPETNSQVIVRVEIRKGPKSKIVKHDGLAHMELPRLVKHMSRGRHVYLPGPPGSSKSHSAEQATEMLGWKFGALSLGPNTPESRLNGGMDAHGIFHDTNMIKVIKHAMENSDSGGAFCLDEADNGNGGNLATLNSALANGWFYAPNGEKLTLGPNMVFIMCANTYGTGPTAQFAGRNRLDPATLNRFIYLPWETDLGLERALVVATLEENPAMASAWLQVWNETRSKVKNNGLNIFVTMRGAIYGAQALADGDDLETTWMDVLGNSIPEDQREKVLPKW